LINLKNSFFKLEIVDYSPWARFFSLGLLVHNLMAAYYAYALFHWYLALSLKNMHSVEDTMVSSLYERGERLGIIN